MSSRKSKKLIKELMHSRKIVGEIYPVLRTKDGRILVGKHRAAAGWQWGVIVDDLLQKIAKELGVSLKAAEKILIIHSNKQRRPSKKETQSHLIELCKALEEMGYPTDKIAQRVAELVSDKYDERYVLSLLPDKYKQQQKAVSPGRPSQVVNFKLTKLAGYEILPPIRIPSQLYQEFVCLVKEANLDLEELIVGLIKEWVDRHRPQNKTEPVTKEWSAEQVFGVIKSLWGDKPFASDDIDENILSLLGMSEDEFIDTLDELVSKNLLQYEDRGGVSVFIPKR
jgi:hypothetical protein